MGLFKKKNDVDWYDMEKLRSLGMEEFYIRSGRKDKVYFVFVDLKEVQISLDLVSRVFWERFFADIVTNTKKDDYSDPSYVVVSPAVMDMSFVRPGYAGVMDPVAKTYMEKAIRTYGEAVGQEFFHDSMGDYTAKDRISYANAVYQCWVSQREWD